MQPVLWITGLPGSGKSTIAEGLTKALPQMVLLRMDEIRKVITPVPVYTDTERDLVYRSMVYTAKLLSELGHPVLIDATGNMRKWRELARELIPGFTEVYLTCPLSLCAKREAVRTDTHGAPAEIYSKAKEGWPVPGMNAPYEEPLRPEVTIETARVSPAEAVRKIIAFIENSSPERKQ